MFDACLYLVGDGCILVFYQILYYVRVAVLNGLFKQVEFIIWVKRGWMGGFQIIDYEVIDLVVVAGYC